MGGPGRVAVAGQQGVGTPLCDFCPNPKFTDEAIKVRYSGTVLLRAVVSEDGRATNISIVRTAGFGLDDRAIEAVRQWRFHPARGRDNRPVAVWVYIEVSFRQL